jgi:ADP-ribose pyrophosphatase YjhB (NUDIX family)
MRSALIPIDMNQELHFFGKVAVKALIRNGEGKVLVCMNSYPGEPWDLPGGTLNAGEHPHDALVREVKEELGVDIEVGMPFAVDHFLKRATGKQTVFIALHATLKNPHAEFVFSDGEITEVQWVGKEDINSMEFFPVYRMLFEAYFK